MQSMASASVQVPTRSSEMPELLASVLTGLGWQGLFVNERMRMATARENRSRAGVSVNWHMEFQLTVNWTNQAMGATVFVSVSERRNQWTAQECQVRVDEICQTLNQAGYFLNEHAEDELLKSDKYGTASWCDSAELERAGYIAQADAADRLLIGKDELGRLISVPPGSTCKHALVCGPTGCGKTSGVLIPNLIMRTQASAIVTEATAGAEPPDLYSKTAGFRSISGHQIFYFNPDDAASNCLNPLDAVKDIESAMLLANLLIENTSLTYKQSADPIWENSERHLLTALFYHAAALRANFSQVRMWVRDGQESLSDFLSHSPLPGVSKEYKGFLALSTEGYRNGVLSGVLQRLSLWLNPKIAKLTERTEIDLNSLGDELFTFYLAMPAHKTHLRPLAALMLNFVLTVVLEKKRLSHPLMLMLDEFTNYGYIPGFVEKLGTIRHRKIPVVIGFQDYSQVRKRYGMEDAETIFTQMGTRIFFRTRAVETAKKISDALGKKTVVERKVSSGGHLTVREFGRQLLEPAEIMNLHPDRIVTFTPDTNPCLLTRFDWKQFQHETSFPCPVVPEKEVTDELKEFCSIMEIEPPYKKQWDQKSSSPSKNSAKPNQDRKRKYPVRTERKKRIPAQEEERHDSGEQEESPPPII